MIHQSYLAALALFCGLSLSVAAQVAADEATPLAEQDVAAAERRLADFDKQIADYFPTSQKFIDLRKARMDYYHQVEPRLLQLLAIRQSEFQALAREMRPTAAPLQAKQAEVNRLQRLCAPSFVAESVAKLLDTVRANKSKEHASTAMAALDDALRLDPANKDALRLRDSVRFENSIGMKFAYIPAGEFDMGSPASEPGRNLDEALHHVKITKPFMIATTTITQAEWKTVMKNNPSHFLGDNRPVEQISWSDAATFCEKLGATEGKHYRLPTEAEWEYACRGGTQTAFSFGNSSLGDFAWYSANSGKQTHDVGTKKPNLWGLYDMQGNVMQWCSDVYAPYGGDTVDPLGGNDQGNRRPSTRPSDDNFVQSGSKNTSPRVLRGAPWNYDSSDCRAGWRISSSPDARTSNIGLRVCLDF